MIKGKTVVYTAGTFDMLHVNHLKMLSYARALGDILIVGVNTDELVTSYKSTPIGNSIDHGAQLFITWRCGTSNLTPLPS